MTNGKKKGQWGFWKQQFPTIWMVASFVVFMNADSALTAAIGGGAAMAGVVWMVVQKRRALKPLGQPVFRLGHMAAAGPTRMRGWHGLGAFAFALLGVLMFFGIAETNFPARIGMVLVTVSVAGAFLVMASPNLRTVGVLVFGVGFVIAGGMFLWEALDTIRAGDENASLTATKWTIFALFVLCGGLPTAAAVLFGRGGTPIYDGGVAGPYGFVPWEAAEKVELIDRNGVSILVVGAYKGWELWIRVPESLHDAVTTFVSEKGKVPADAVETAETETAG